MPKEVELNKTEFLFTAPNETADAIGLVAGIYSDDEVKVNVMPISNHDEAIAALGRVIGRAGDRWQNYTEKDRHAVSLRYVQLGEANTDSQIELIVPRGAQDFDWEGFYNQVKIYL